MFWPVSVQNNSSSGTCPPQPQQNEPAFAISGWQHQTGQNGVEFYFCRQDFCGRDSRVSYQVLSGTKRYTLDEFGAEKAQARGLSCLDRR